jgi:hypothetical protein
MISHIITIISYIITIISHIMPIINHITVLDWVSSLAFKTGGTHKWGDGRKPEYGCLNIFGQTPRAII